MEVKITASNLIGSIDQHFDLEYKSKIVAQDELIRLDELRYHIAFPMMRQFNEAFNADNLEWFDFVDGEDEGSA